MVSNVAKFAAVCQTTYSISCSPKSNKRTEKDRHNFTCLTMHRVRFAV